MSEEVKRPAWTELPCRNCGSLDWWYRKPCKIFDSVSPGEWLCGLCHPDPNRDVNKGGVKDGQVPEGRNPTN